MAIVTDMTKTTVIDGDDFDAAANSAKVRDLVAEAIEYGKSLRASGRDHTLASAA
jgi:hypothetical protein